MSSKPGTQNSPSSWISTSILWPIGACRQTGANRLSVRQVLIKRTGKVNRELFYILVCWEEYSHGAEVWQSPLTYVGTWYVYGFRIFKDMWKPEVLRCPYINPNIHRKGPPLPRSVARSTRSYQQTLPYFCTSCGLLLDPCQRRGFYLHFQRHKSPQISSQEQWWYVLPILAQTVTITQRQRPYDSNNSRINFQPCYPRPSDKKFHTIS